jgi:hypothetical protein
MQGAMSELRGDSDNLDMKLHAIDHFEGARECSL